VFLLGVRPLLYLQLGCCLSSRHFPLILLQVKRQYVEGCNSAYEAVERAFAEATDIYYRRIGELAVRRDNAIRLAFQVPEFGCIDCAKAFSP
jgi:hypothetical protein